MCAELCYLPIVYNATDTAVDTSLIGFSSWLCFLAIYLMLIWHLLHLLHLQAHNMQPSFLIHTVYLDAQQIPPIGWDC